jgi:hypothetical protein
MYHYQLLSLLGCVYIPPENSKYSTIDAFTEIENEFISLLGNNSRYALVGDFNAKTSDLPDFCCPDEHFLDKSVLEKFKYLSYSCLNTIVIPPDFLQNFCLHLENDLYPFGKLRISKSSILLSKTGVLNETDLSVNEQYPMAINERRQALLPKLREEKRKNNRAFIRYDKL